MQSAIRHGAIMVALVGAVGLVAAHQSGAGLNSTAGIVGPTFPDDEITGSIGRSTWSEWIELSDEQRGWIFLGVMNLPDVPETDSAALEPTDALPNQIELHDMPAMVTRKIPMMRDHKFVKLDDRILLVRAGDRTVVSEIPRYRLLP
jgi:hypothetical protein